MTEKTWIVSIVHMTFCALNWRSLSQLHGTYDFFTDSSRLSQRPTKETGRSKRNASSKKPDKADNKNTMSLLEFQECLRELGVIGELFSERSVPYAFAVGLGFPEK